MARLILDTGVLIAGQQGRLELTALGKGDDIALPTTAVAEYLAGVTLGQVSHWAATRPVVLPRPLFSTSCLR